jgi:hypothetical protein
VRPAPLLLAAALLGAIAGQARAQADSTAAAPADSARVAAPSGTPAVVGWGKWAAAAVAVGFTTVGIEQHNGANGAFRSLIQYCGATACTFTPDGRYADSRAEATYQVVVRRDRAARLWLLAGQVTAVGTAVLFVLDLMRPRGPENIPYSGLLLESAEGVTRVGFRIPIGTGR